MRQWLVALIILSFRYFTASTSMHTNKVLVAFAEKDLISCGYYTTLLDEFYENVLWNDRHNKKSEKSLDELLQRESLDVINREKLLVPTFKNNCDHPDDISEVPFGYQAYITNYPKFERPEGKSRYLGVTSLEKL